MIMVYRSESRAVFLYGFAKNDRDNIGPDELRTFRTIEANWLTVSAAALRLALDDGALQEIGHDDEEA